MQPSHTLLIMKTLYSVALVLLFATKTFATVTLNLSAAYLNNAGGTVNE